MVTSKLGSLHSVAAPGGGGQPGHVPHPGCAPSVGWPLGGRDSSSLLTKLSQMLGTGGCMLLQMSPLPVVTAVQCQC